MDKNLSEKYERLSCIYDDSADLHRAIALSDAYYGDYSSLVALYKATNKPLMLQNIQIGEVNESDQDDWLHSDAIIFGTQVLPVDEFKVKCPEYYKYWLTIRSEKALSKYASVVDCKYGNSTDFNAVYQCNEKVGTADFYFSFPNHNYEPWHYHTPIRINQKMIFAPARSRRWAFYDMDKNNWSFEDVPTMFHPTLDYRYTFNGGIVYDDCIIFYPGERGAFAKYNIESGKITYYSDWFNTLKPYVKNLDIGLLSGIFYYKESLLLVSPHFNMVIELNPSNMEVICTYKIGNYPMGFKHAVFLPSTNTMYFILFRNPEIAKWNETIVKWNVETGQVTEFNNLPIVDKVGGRANLLNVFILWKSALYVTPLEGDSILGIDLETDEISRLALKPEIDFFARKSQHYSWAKGAALPYTVFCPERMTFIAQLPYDYSLADIDMESGKMTNRRKWKVTGIEKFKEVKVLNCLYECEYLSLNKFMSNYMINNCKNVQNADEKNAGKIEVLSGNKIYEYTKKITGVRNG